MRILVLKTCDTCRRAVKDLRAAGHAPEVVDIRADGLSEADRAALVAAFGDKAVNRASTTWRGLSEAEREAPAEALLAAHPTLMRRPVIMAGERITQGWSAEVRESWL